MAKVGTTHFGEATSQWTTRRSMVDTLRRRMYTIATTHTFSFSEIGGREYLLWMDGYIKYVPTLCEVTLTSDSPSRSIMHLDVD
jgi:hypothetical protein